MERLDPHGLLGRIEALPEQCEDAWRHAGDIELPPGFSDAREVVLLGMGGSAIAGDILRSLAAEGGHKPVYVARGYAAPAFVDEHSLAIACSHSGNTEETLSAFEQALTAGADGLAVTTGGRIEELARERGAFVVRYAYEGEPRSALGCQLMRLLAVAERAGVLDGVDAAVVEAVALMREDRGRLGFDTPADRNPAKQLAGRLHGQLPVVIGAGALSEAAHRWKTQLNENSECWALWEELPELDHNSIVGIGQPAAVVSRMHVVFLWHSALHPRVRLRYEVTAEALASAGVSYERVDAAGTSPLAQVLSAILFGDLTSYYLALLNGVEPSPVAWLDWVKEQLAKG